ncbi:MAG TPA: hypothetical protein VEZ40_21165 [Pyrinomonadaceae bacterium]|nr:hypothetical protein [Pyrinomonadaceae bacterium]
MLCAVLAGWRRGAYSFRRGDILAATAFASLDVPVPTMLAALVWLLLRSMKNGGALLF